MVVEFATEQLKDTVATDIFDSVISEMDIA